MFKIRSYSNLSVLEKEDFFNFCKNESLATNDLAHSNIWSEDWETKNNSLLYLLAFTDRFKSPNGDFNIVYCGDEIAAIGGVYKSDFDETLSLAGTRAWATKKYRNTLIFRNILLPYHKDWSIQHGCKATALCFNDYNRNIIKTFKRTRLGEDHTRMQSREPHHLFYANFNEVGYRVDIQFTPQWVIYETFDPDWKYDWTQIKTV